MAFSYARCRFSDMFTRVRKRRFIACALIIVVCFYLVSQRETGDTNLQRSNNDLLLALGRQGSARDKHGHKFRYLGIDGKWIPVSDSPVAQGHETGSSKTSTERGGYHLDQPSRRDFSRGQSLVIDKLLDQQVNGYFLDIGAGDGETNSITLFFERWRHWDGVLIEPDEEKYEFIQSKNRQARAWQTCIMTSNMTYFRGTEPCVAITHVLESLERNSFDLVTVNVKGHAYDIIKMIDLNGYKVKVFSVEFDHDEERNLEYNQVTKHLLQRGYAVKHILIEKHLHKMDVIYMLM